MDTGAYLNQELFVRLASIRWGKLEDAFKALKAGDKARVAELPALYRGVCRDLAVARQRCFSTDLIDYLNDLVQRGQRSLHRRPSGWRRFVRLWVRDFPRAVRSEWRLVLAAFVLFYGTALGVWLLVKAHPELVYTLLDRESVAQMEEIYDPAGGRIGVPRGMDDDVQMFGFYIYNNISVAFRTFAGGILAGVGSLLVVVFNGLFFGAVAGHLSNVGFSGNLWPFVIGHGSFELTAILLAGAAGFRLGSAVIAPGLLRRADALRLAGTKALPIMYGAAAMLVVAAVLEAFWSSSTSISDTTKFAVGGLLWALVAAYLLLAGWRRADRERADRERADRERTDRERAD